MREKALLIGNDVNNATETYSWNDLIDGLLEYAKLGKLDRNKPFPLLYEEIYLNSAKQNRISESGLKKHISTQTRKLNPNDLHRQILDLGIADIMTTNYDLSFEKTAGLDKKKCINKGVIKENLYSVFRYHQTENHKIWHIHGSEIATKSITLGYEHYSGYLQQMRNYVATGTRGIYSKKDFLPLSKRIKENDINYDSWIDFFFKKDIYIFGLNMDFVEMHLWWLLTYRARAIVENRFPVENKIVYFYPKQFEETSKNKLEMFKVNCVDTTAIEMKNDNKFQYYESVIEKIRNGK